jgi:major capsid protein gp7
MSVTLLEASKLHTGDVVRSAVIEMFARSGDLMRVMKWQDMPGGSYHYNQEGQLPGVAFRGVNEAFAESAGILNPQVEVLRIAGGDLDVDKALIKFHGEGVRQQHEAMKVKALGLYIMKKIVKGDSVVEPREFDGLMNRINGAQLVDAGNTNGGDALKLSTLDQVIDVVDNPTHLLTSKATRRRLTAAARTTTVGGFISYAVDEFGEKITQYNDIPILIVDYDDTGARILDYNEVGAGGATATAVSLYCVSIGDGMLTGLQNGVMDVRDLGELPDKAVMRTRIDWYVGLAAMHGRCAARLRGIADAAVVA